MKIIKHFITITTHKKEVMRLCFKCGLYKRGILHDLSKYSPQEFNESYKYYVGDISPITKCREIKGYSMAWLHHKGKNKHHPEYWIDNDNYIRMPYEYAVESICDRIAATKIYQKKEYTNKKPYKYWKNQEKEFKINDRTALFYDRVLDDLQKYGEKEVINKKYMKKTFQEICMKD